MSAVTPDDAYRVSVDAFRVRAGFGVGARDHYFDRQATPSANLPDPGPLVENLARSVVEILAGVREIEQIARWMTEDVYHHLLRRVVLASRSRAARRVSVARPDYRIGAVRITTPADGVVEATVILNGRIRSRAIAMRLEGLDSRWRATALVVL